MDGGYTEILSTAHSDVDAARIGDSVLGHTGDALPVCVVGGSTALILGREEGWNGRRDGMGGGMGGGMRGKSSNLHFYPTQPFPTHPTHFFLQFVQNSGCFVVFNVILHLLPEALVKL